MKKLLILTVLIANAYGADITETENPENLISGITPTIMNKAREEEIN